MTRPHDDPTAAHVPSDPAAFLAAAGRRPALDGTADLRADLEARWLAGDRVPAEDYLARFPAVCGDPSAAVDVIYVEYLVRERLGDRPDPAEYARRFPEYAAVLRDQIGLHAALGPTGGAAPNDRTTGSVPRADPGHATGEDLRKVLRTRLRFLAGLTASGMAGGALLIATADAIYDPWAYPILGVFSLGAATSAVLWARPGLSLAQLRGIEVALFGALYAAWASGQAFVYPELALIPPPVWFGFILGYAVSLPWVLLIVGYGVLIPNTARRCAIVVGVMAVTPLVISAANGMGARATAGHSPANYFLVVGVWVGSAAALAIYSSHRIDVLRRAAVEARKLGPYALARKLGEGGMGEVWLAEHRLLKRPCAVKFVRPELAAHPTNVARFEREVRAVTGLSHFHTVRVYDYGRADDGSFYFVMEYLDGPTLQRLVEESGPLSPGRAVYLLRPVCGALAEAHAAGLVHRDLKPGNVIVATLGGQHDVAKLLDFGLVSDLATADDRLTQAGVVMGTPAYMPPEQAEGTATADARGDVYGLGAVAFFALAGRPPFEGRSAGQVIAARLTQDAPDVRAVRPDVPADLAAVVARCLARDPADRFPTVADLDRALAACGCAGEWSADAAAKWWATRGGDA